MSEASAFSDAEWNLVRTTLRERYGRDVAVEEVETEIRLSPADRELTVCSALFWKEEGCSFVISKTGDSKFRSMFFWSIRDRYATGREEYDNLGDCVVTTLKMQEEAARRRAEDAGT